MLAKAYLVIGAVLLGTYAGIALGGFEFGKTVLKRTPPAARSYSRSGSRGFFYGGGFGGGK